VEAPAAPPGSEYESASRDNAAGFHLGYIVSPWNSGDGISRKRDRHQCPTPPAIAFAAPVDGRGRRSNETLLRLDELDKLLVEIACRFYPGVSHRETAHRLRRSWLLYQQGRWRRTCAELKPPHDPRSLDAALWHLLWIRDYVPSEMTIRRALLFVNHAT
jgi:hypothetical protein